MRELEKAQRMALRIREAVGHEQGRCLPLEKCGKLGLDLGFDEKTGMGFPSRHPRMFQVVESRETRGAQCVKLSSEADAVLNRKIDKDPYCVYVLRKLLMLCKNERIHVVKLMRNRCFNFPDALTHKVLTRHPDCFHWDKRPLSMWGTLRLVSWDDDLAVPVREKTRQLLQQNRESDAFQLGVPVENECGLQTVIGNKELRELHTLPLVSPYNRSQVFPGGKVAERKRKISLLHEFLSLVKLKKASLTDITDLLEEFELGDEPLLEPFLNKERQFFVVRRLDKRTHVFLREGYEWDHHISLRPAFQVKREFLHLLTAELDNKDSNELTLTTTERLDTEDSPAKTAAALREG